MELTELTDAELRAVAGGQATVPPPLPGNTAIAVGALASNSAVVSQVNRARASNIVTIPGVIF